MLNRRKFLTKVSASSIGALIGTTILNRTSHALTPPRKVKKSGPLVISTWNHGLDANEEAMRVIMEGGRAVDACEAGVRIPEADPNNLSVGLGGLPDRDGKVTLDAILVFIKPQQFKGRKIILVYWAGKI